MTEKINIDLDDISAFLSRKPRGNPRVYIASSLTTRDGTGLRDQILNHAESLFKAAGFDAYSPSKFTRPGSPHHNNEVYAIDVRNVIQSDLIFFVRLQPSLGMGLESQIAANYLIPWAEAVMGNNHYTDTPLLFGLPNCPNTGTHFHFNTIEEFDHHLKDRLLDRNQMRTRAQEFQKQKQILYEIVEQLELGMTIRRQRLLLHLSAEELSKSADIAPWWIESIEREHSLAIGLTLIQVMRLVKALRLRFSATTLTSRNATLPRLVPIDSFPRPLIEAANEFAKYSLHPRDFAEPPGPTDERLLEHWDQWLSKKGISPNPPQLTRQPIRNTTELTACLAFPISNVNQDEKAKINEIKDAIRGALEKNTNSVRITCREPEVWKQARPDFGSPIYLKTLSRISDSDFGIVIATPPATGVGITMQLFANSTMPAMTIAADADGVSRMFQGVPCPFLSPIVEFSKRPNLQESIETILAYQMEALLRSAAQRREAAGLISSTSLKNAIDRHRIPRNLSQAEVLNQLDKVSFIRKEWLRYLFESDAILPNVTLLQFVHIALHFGWNISVSQSGVPCWDPGCSDRESDQNWTAEQRAAAEASLDNLVDALHEIQNNNSSLFEFDDNVVYEQWDNYCHELVLDAARHETRRLVRSKKKWLDLLNETNSF
jgi:hypothetical protein